MAYAEEEKLRVLWLTRTGSEVRQVAVETGCLPLYGRRMVCLHETVSQIDLRRFSAACRATRLAGRCPYWPGRPRALRGEKTVGELKTLGKLYTSCPYDFLVVSMPSSRMVAATHRQLRLLQWIFYRWRWTRERTLLVLDEGQHVVREALSMTRDSISLRTLKRAAREAGKYGFEELSRELGGAVERYSGILREDGEAEVEDLLPSYDDLLLAGQEVQDAKLRGNIVPASHVLSVADFKASLRGERPLLVREGERMRLEALGDPKEELERVYGGWAATITLSATISGELLEAVLGREVTLLRAGWPFPETCLRASIVKGITTRYPARDEALYENAAWLVKVAMKAGKALVFLPSHDVLEEVLRRLGRGDVLAERRGMVQEEVEAMAKGFRESGGALLTVFSGRLAEGVDLPADVVLLIGVPFARPSPRISMLLRRMREILGDEERARIYGYVLPAVWSAVQAAGRAVRGPEDRTTVFLVDDRYRPLKKFLPRWFDERVEGEADVQDVPILLEADGR